ncbi:MAG TPA: DUF2087 domain-containing protein [Ilumatobacteraceae bacterium]|nr:DUF2087 domain-containing protein [Ilumatobacteraceae bacterium]
MPDLDAAALVGLLADPQRRRVVAAIELGAHHVDDVERATGLKAAQIAKALGKLVESGLVVQTDRGLVLAADAFRDAAREAMTRPASSEFDDQPEEARKVLRAFVSSGRLKSIPVAAAKRRVVLDWLAQEFEPGRRYSEQMVNLILGQRHSDTAALRRYLVDDGFLDRAGGEYWRSGGTVGE